MEIIFVLYFSLKYSNFPVLESTFKLTFPTPFYTFSVYSNCITWLFRPFQNTYNTSSTNSSISMRPLNLYYLSLLFTLITLIFYYVSLTQTIKILSITPLAHLLFIFIHVLTNILTFGQTQVLWVWWSTTCHYLAIPQSRYYSEMGFFYTFFSIRLKFIIKRSLLHDFALSSQDRKFQIEIRFFIEWVEAHY